MLEMFKNRELVIELENENQIGEIICWAKGIGLISTLGCEYYERKNKEYGKIGFSNYNNYLNGTDLQYYKNKGYKTVTWTEFTKSLRKFTLSNLLDTHVVIRVFSEEEARKVVSTFIQKDVSSLDYFLLWDALGDNLAFSIVSKDGENILIPHDVSLLVDTITQLTIDEVDFEELKEVNFMDAMCNKEFKVDNSGILYILAQDCIKENINIQNVHVRICDDRFITPSEFMAWLSSIASDEEIKQVIKESKFYVEGC